MARYPLKTDYGVKSNQVAVIADRLLIPMDVRNSRFMYHHDQKKLRVTYSEPYCVSRQSPTHEGPTYVYDHFDGFTCSSTYVDSCY